MDICYYNDRGVPSSTFVVNSVDTKPSTHRAWVRSSIPEASVSVIAFDPSLPSHRQA